MTTSTKQAAAMTQPSAPKVTATMVNMGHTSRPTGVGDGPPKKFSTDRDFTAEEEKAAREKWLAKHLRFDLQDRVLGAMARRGWTIENLKESVEALRRLSMGQPKVIAKPASTGASEDKELASSGFAVDEGLMEDLKAASRLLHLDVAFATQLMVHIPEGIFPKKWRDEARKDAAKAKKPRRKK